MLGAKKAPLTFRQITSALGPGLVTGAADDDPSGIATYSQAGARFGFNLLWTVFLTTPFMIAIQLVSAHIGRVTGKGIAANAKEHHHTSIVFILVSLLLAANIFKSAADIAAMGEAHAALGRRRTKTRARSNFCGRFCAATGICALQQICSAI